MSKSVWDPKTGTLTSYAVAPKPQSSGGGGGGQQKQNGGWYNGVQYWAPGQGPQNSNPQIQSDNGGGGGLDSEFERQLNEAYDTSMRAADTAASNAQSGFEADTKNLNSRVANSIQDVDTEAGNLNQSTNTEQDKFNQVLRSALSEAVRSFNALQQQARSRFGAGSSAGQAVGELAQQEYFKQQGQVQQKGVEGTAQFADERAKIGQFVSQKKRDLDQYKQEALDALTKNLKDTMAAIEARKGDIASNKAQARMSALMEARSKAEAIAQQDKEFRQNLGLAAVTQLQQVTGKTFTPAEIKAYIDEFMTDLPGNVGAGQAQGGGNVALAPMFKPDKKDELSDVTGTPAYVNQQRKLTQPARNSYLA